MAAVTLLVSTLVMGLLLAVILVAVTRRGTKRSYSVALSGGGGGRSNVESTAPGVSENWMLALVGVIVLAALGAAVVFADGGLVFGGLVAALLLAYLSWGIYQSARYRGLPSAHSVGLTVWVVGIVLSAAIGVKLLLA
jgi:hypothetical protein